MRCLTRRHRLLRYSGTYHTPVYENHATLAHFMEEELYRGVTASAHFTVSVC